MKILSRWLMGVTALTSLFMAPQALACPFVPTYAQMCVVGFNFAPRGWALAQGQVVSISSNTALFSILGTTYGGDGRTTFNLPDTRGRVVIGQGRGPGLSDYRLGQEGGVESVTLNVLQIPSHNHTVSAPLNVEVTGTIQLTGISARANQASLDGNAMARTSGSTRVYKVANGDVPTVGMHPDSLAVTVPDISVSGTASVTLSNSGSNQAHENRMPSLAMYWIIATTGIYPSRS